MMRLIKGLIKFVVVLFVVVLLLGFAISHFGGERKKQARSSTVVADNKPAPTFELVSHRNKGTGHQFTYYVAAATKEQAKEFCEKVIAKYPGKHVMIYIYNNRKMTPDISEKLDFPPESVPYLLAHYWVNPSNRKSEYLYGKEIAR